MMTTKPAPRIRKPVTILAEFDGAIYAVARVPNTDRFACEITNRSGGTGPDAASYTVSFDEKAGRFVCECRGHLRWADRKPGFECRRVRILRHVAKN